VKSTLGSPAENKGMSRQSEPNSANNRVNNAADSCRTAQPLMIAGGIGAGALAVGAGALAVGEIKSDSKKKEESDEFCDCGFCWCCNCGILLGHCCGADSVLYQSCVPCYQTFCCVTFIDNIQFCCSGACDGCCSKESCFTCFETCTRSVCECLG